MCGTESDFDHDDIDDAAVRPEILDRARETGGRYAIREARLAGRLQNLTALAAAGHATLDDQVHLMLTWLAVHTFRLSPTELMPQGRLAARRAESRYALDGPGGPELTLA